MGIVIGYARTSTADQVAGLEAQITRLEAEKCARIFSEQISGRAEERPELERALDYIRDGDGDMLIVTKLDRLARSVKDALEIAQRLKAKGATLKVLDSPIDLSSPFGELLFAILAAIAQFERDLMLERQREGIAKAKRDGKMRGRPNYAVRRGPEVLELWATGMSIPRIAEQLKISARSINRVLADARKEGKIGQRIITASVGTAPVD